MRLVISSKPSDGYDRPVAYVANSNEAISVGRKPDIGHETFSLCSEPLCPQPLNLDLYSLH